MPGCLHPARTLAGPQSSLQGLLGGPEPQLLPVFQHRPLGVEEEEEKGLGLSGVGSLWALLMSHGNPHTPKYTHMFTHGHIPGT